MNAKETQNSRERQEEEKRLCAKRMWLNYYNRRVYQEGLISKEEYVQMDLLIYMATIYDNGRNRS